MATEAWIHEKATIGEGDEVANSLAARILLLQASILDVSAIKAVTDLIPDAGAMSDLALIEAVTTLLPDAGALTSISDETDKIDGAATDGLTGVSNSTAYRIHEAERHFHSFERWFELAAVPAAETHRADRIGGGNGPFVIDAGNDDWGAWVQILGSADTPAEAGMVKFDLHRIEISATERNFTYFIQIGIGASGAAALSAETFTEAVFQPASNQVDSGPVVIQTRRADAGTKAWARCMCPGQNTATMSLYFGIHEYQG